ncbi:unnamed protein product [Lota lota]
MQMVLNVVGEVDSGVVVMKMVLNVVMVVALTMVVVRIKLLAIVMKMVVAAINHPCGGTAPSPSLSLLKVSAGNSIAPADFDATPLCVQNGVRAESRAGLVWARRPSSVTVRRGR